MGRLNLSLDLKDDMRNLFGFVFGKVRVNEWPLSWKLYFSLYVTSLINMSVELIPWWETWYLNLYGCKFGKMNVVKLLWPENKILAYMLRSLNLCLDVPWCETWYVNLFGFVFGIMNVFKLTLSRKWDFGLYAYKFDKWEGWICPLI